MQGQHDAVVTDQDISPEEAKALESLKQFFDSPEKDYAELCKFLGVDLASRAGTGAFYRLVASALEQFAFPAGLSFKPDVGVPLNQTVLFMAHNAYNTAGSGLTSFLPNQTKSLAELLGIGVRAFELDVYAKEGQFLLYHALCNKDLSKYLKSSLNFLFGENRNLADALKEFRTFLEQNPNEALVIKIEDHLGSQVRGASALIQDSLGITSDAIFTPADLQLNGGAWPSMQEMVDGGKRIMFLTENLSRSTDIFINTPHTEDALSPTRYYSAYQFFQALESGKYTPDPKRLTEIGEDRLPGFAEFVDSLEKLSPAAREKVRGLGGGKLTKENIAMLQDMAKKGEFGGIVGLDHMDQKDPRFLEGLIVNLGGDYRYFIPAAILGAVLAAGSRSLSEQESKKLKFLGKGADIAIRTLVYVTLPRTAMYLFETADGAIKSFSKQSAEKAKKGLDKADQTWSEMIVTTGEKLSTAAVAGVGQAIETGIKLALISGIVAATDYYTRPFEEDHPYATTSTRVLHTAVASAIVNLATSTVKYAAKSGMEKFNSWWRQTAQKPAAEDVVHSTHDEQEEEFADAREFFIDESGKVYTINENGGKEFIEGIKFSVDEDGKAFVVDDRGERISVKLPQDEEENNLIHQSGSAPQA